MEGAVFLFTPTTFRPEPRVCRTEPRPDQRRPPRFRGLVWSECSHQFRLARVSLAALSELVIWLSRSRWAIRLEPRDSRSWCGLSISEQLAVVGGCRRSQANVSSSRASLAVVGEKIFRDKRTNMLVLQILVAESRVTRASETLMCTLCSHQLPSVPRKAHSIHSRVSRQLDVNTLLLSVALALAQLVRASGLLALVKKREGYIYMLGNPLFPCKIGREERLRSLSPLK